MNIMDASGAALPNSPYSVTPTSVKGIASVTIPQADLDGLDEQYLTYSVTCIKDGLDTILYGDTRFGASGTIQIIGNAMPVFRDPQVLKTYTGEIDLNGNIINHYSAIPAKFYEAIPTTQLTFEISVTGFIGTVWLEGTTTDTISVDSFKHSTRLMSQTLSVATTTTVTFSNVDVNDFTYFRVSFQGDSPLTPTGTVDKVTVS
jgi:hypothetical protein